MNKKCKRGFVLIETILISAVVMGVLLTLYIQLNAINNSYNKLLTYDNVDKLYLVNNVKQYLYNNGLKETDFLNGFYDISDCSNALVNEYAYCKNLFANLDASVVIVSSGDLTLLKESINTNPNYSSGFKEYVNQLTNQEGIYIILEFSDLEYASLVVEDKI